MKTTGIQTNAPVVLASGSSQRRKLLSRLIDDFEIVVPHIKEDVHPGENARDLVERLAREKGLSVAQKRPDSIVIAGDTVVECQGEIIGKPASHRDAVRILKKITTMPHHVVCGLCVAEPGGQTHSAIEAPEIHMKEMSMDEIERYIKNNNVMERAGAYGLKAFDPNVQKINGSRSAVMGLALEKLEDILADIS